MRRTTVEPVGIKTSNIPRKLRPAPARRNENGWSKFLRGAFAGKWRSVMFSRLVLGATLMLAATPGLAGPCTQRIAELEKSIVAKHEGAGPALAAPSTTGS